MLEEDYRLLKQLYYNLNLDILRLDRVDRLTAQILIGFKPHPTDGTNGIRTFEKALLDHGVTMIEFLNKIDLEFGQRAIRSPDFAIFCAFMDGCPSDWLSPQSDERWHTIVTANFQLKEDALLRKIGEEDGFFELSKADEYVNGFFDGLERGLPNGRLSKWVGKQSYRSRFIGAFDANDSHDHPAINAYSFQEGTLRRSAESLIRAYKSKILNPPLIERQTVDATRIIYSFSLPGLEPITIPEEKALVIVLLAWAFLDQWNFLRMQLVDSQQFKGLKFAIATDNLSSDGRDRRPSETLLHMLLPGDIAAVRMRKADRLYLFVDNMAGWFDEVISNFHCEAAMRLMASQKLNFISEGWYEMLDPVDGKLAARLVMPRLIGKDSPIVTQ